MPWKTLKPSSKSDHPSDAQIKRLYTIATSNGWNHERVKTMVYITWHKNSTKDLTMNEYEELIDYMFFHEEKGAKKI